MDPSHINVSILAPGDTGMDTLTTVPEGYIVDFSFFNNNNIDVSSNNFKKTANQSLSNIELPKGTYVGDISRLRIRLIKDEAGVPAASLATSSTAIKTSLNKKKKIKSFIRSY